MNTETHRQLANDIWSICNLLRGPYKRNEYRKVILPLTVLRRFDCLLASSKAQILETFNPYKGKPESIIRTIFDHSKVGEQISKMAETNLLLQVIEQFAICDLSFSGWSRGGAFYGLTSAAPAPRIRPNTPAMPLHDAHFGGFFVSRVCG